MIKRIALLLCALAIASSLSAQEEPEAPTPQLPVGDQLLTLPSTHMAAHGLWEIKFTHRFNQSLSNGSFSDQLHSLFGLDTNADVSFGLSYSIGPRLQLYAARSNTNDTIEAAAKYVVLQQSQSIPLNLAVRGGVDYRTERDLEDRNSFFVQTLVSRRMGKVEVFAMPTFVTDAGRAVTIDSSGALFEHAFNVPVGVTYFVRPPVAIVAEIIPPNGDLPDEANGDFGWAFGIKRAIGGHWFEILVTNSQGTTVDQYASSTYQGAGFDSGEVKLGFNIERRFGRRKR